MRILLIITKGEPGGATEVVRNLALELNKQGHEVAVAFGEGEYLSDELKNVPIEIIRFKHLKRTCNPVENLRFMHEVRRFVKNRMVDAVHTHSSNALLAACAVKKAKKGTRTSFTFHGLSFLHPAHGNVLIRFAYRIIFRWLLGYVDEAIFISEYDRNQALRQKIVPQNKTTIAPNHIIAPEFLERDVARKMISEKIGKELPDFPIIGSIGRLAYPKNYEFLIRACADLKEKYPFACLLIGEGPERKKYEELISHMKFQNQVFLTGEILKAGRLMRAFDVFILVSVYEGSPITVLEAMHAGVPVLAPRVGGIPELLDGDEFQLFEPNNTEDFLKKLFMLLDSSDLRKKLGEENKHRSDKYVLPQ